MIAYLDTSAFIKLIIREPGSDEAASIWERARLITSSRLLYPEARAALAAAVRSGRAPSRNAVALRRELEDFWGDVACVEVTPTLASRAGDLAQAHRLRGYDAVHLSSVLEVEAAGTILVTADDELAMAARAIGVPTARVPAQSSA